MSFKKNKTEEKATPPVAKVRVGLITAAIREKAKENGTFYNVTFERGYKDSEGNWKSRSSYDTFDLLNPWLTLNRACGPGRSRGTPNMRPERSRGPYGIMACPTPASIS